MVLNGATYNLGGRSRIFIHQNYEAAVAEKTAARGVEHLTGRGAPFSVDHQRAGRQKLTGHLGGSAEITATIHLEVEYETLHSLLLERGDGLVYFLARSGAKTVKMDIAHTRSYHINGIDGIDRDFVARQVERQQAAHTVAHHAE